MTRTPKPVTRIGWHNHYAKRFDKTQHPDAAQLACWYLLLYLELGDTAKFDNP